MRGRKLVPSFKVQGNKIRAFEEYISLVGRHGSWWTLGLVFEAFGEASEEVHGLVHHMANRSLKSEGLQQGRETVKGSWGKFGE